jgi:hypothetical protein
MIEPIDPNTPIIAPATKQIYASKINWTAVVIIAMGVLPLITPFVQVLHDNKDAVAITAGVVTLIGGVLQIIWRTFFTSTTIQ